MTEQQSEHFIIVHLSEDPDISSICERYWATNEDGSFTETVSAICKDVGLPQGKLTRVIGEHSYVYFESHSCPACWTPFALSSRTALQQRLQRVAKLCDDCSAKEAAQLKERKLALLLQSEKEALAEAVAVEDLNFKHAAYLLALIKFAGTEDLSEIGEYGRERAGRLSPSDRMDIEILRALYSNRHIYVSSSSQLAALTLTDGSGQYKFQLDFVRWKIALQDGLSNYTSIYSKLEAHLVERLNREGAPAVRELCDELALEECLAYLENALAEHRLGYEFGDKTRSVITKALNSFSVAEMYNFIWRAAKDAAAFYQRGAGSKDHASKTVLGSIERQCERALANGWQVTPFKRNWNLPQSELSRVVYNFLLGTDDGGFRIRSGEFFTDASSDAVV